MNFKEIVSKDITTTFLNLNEFATDHKLNGRIVKCVIDEDKFENKIRMGTILTQVEGVIRRGITIFIGQEELYAIPHVGEHFKLDDLDYEVLKFKMDIGIYEIDLVIWEEI
ncbi:MULTISPECIES: hypothetical protein [Streptobacillus]|uniref:hypothetical protein n=1 Tax=Streptobacillus TaxID=34104 RepID=UPI0007E46C88|nr:MULTISPECIES: hypothetical protein [Streptobacillus]